MKIFIHSFTLWLLLGLQAFSVQAATPLAKPASATLVIYRPQQHLALRNVYFRTFIDEQQLGKLKVKGLQYKRLTPGEYRLHSNDKTRSGITLQIATDPQDIFIRTEIVRKQQQLTMQYEIQSAAQFKIQQPELWQRYHVEKKHW